MSTMDPSDLLPGLGLLLEERFGRFGRWLTGAVALAAAFFIILSTIGLAIFIVTQLVTFEPFPLPPNDTLGRLAILAAVWIAILAIGGQLFYMLLGAWLRNLDRRIAKTTDGLKQEQEYVAETQKVVAELGEEVEQLLLELAGTNTEVNGRESESEE